MRVQKSKITARINSEHAVVYFAAPAVREMSDVQKVMEEIESISYNYTITLLVINFSKVQHLTSAFLGRLIALQKSLKQAGIALRLCCMSPQVEEAFTICKLQKLIPLFPTEEKALAG